MEWFPFSGQVTSKTSLFTYNPGEDVNTFKNESFVPIFLDNITFASNALEQQAKDICQGDVNCLFDIASTGDTAVGESTKQISVQLETESEELRKLKHLKKTRKHEWGLTEILVSFLPSSAEESRHFYGMTENWICKFYS